MILSKSMPAIKRRATTDHPHKHDRMPVVPTVQSAIYKMSSQGQDLGNVHLNKER